MTNFKLYGKTKHIYIDIKNFALSIGGFTKIIDNSILCIVLTDTKTTKSREKKIFDFAENNNLKCYKNKYDGSMLCDKNISYSGFAKSIN